jgi:hypothetical protein
MSGRKEISKLFLAKQDSHALVFSHFLWLFVRQCFVWLYHRKKCLDFCEWGCRQYPCNLTASSCCVLLVLRAPLRVTKCKFFFILLEFSCFSLFKPSLFLYTLFTITSCFSYWYSKSLTGTIHPDVGGLSQLLNLELYSNQLTGSDPTWGLSQLQWSFICGHLLTLGQSLTLLEGWSTAHYIL